MKHTNAPLHGSQSIIVLLSLVLLACTADRTGTSPQVSADQLKAIRSQVNEAVTELRPLTGIVMIGSFRKEGVCKAAQLLQSFIENPSLGTADAALAARAHRVMAAVYGAAFTTPWSRGDCIHKLLVGDALGKAAHELQTSLRLHPNQPEADKAKQIISEIGKGEDPTIEQLTRYVKFLLEDLGARLSSW